MSEKQQVNYEQDRQSHEAAETTESKLTPAERSRAEKDQSNKLEKARAEARQESSSENRILEKLQTETETVSTKEDFDRRPIDKTLKRATFQKEIKHIRRQLGSSDRLLSRIVHQPTVKAVSEISSKTISRPSGLLGGGITAFIGTGAYLYFSKHIGVKYNYTVFLLLLVGGFVLGVLLEGLVRIFTRKNTAL